MGAALVGLAPEPPAPVGVVLVGSVQVKLDFVLSGQAVPGAAAVLAELFAAFGVVTIFFSDVPSSSEGILPVVEGPFAAFVLLFEHPLE